MFRLEGQPFIAWKGGPQFQFTKAVSLQVNCETQQEIDALWDHLSGGEIGVRQRFELEDLSPSETMERLRRIGMADQK